MEDDLHGLDVWARLEGRALLTLRCGTGAGPGVPSVSGIDEIPEAPQVLPQGPVMVLDPGPELGLGPLARVY